jgi:hypothetical protein
MSTERRFAIAYYSRSSSTKRGGLLWKVLRKLLTYLLAASVITITWSPRLPDPAPAGWQVEVRRYQGASDR